MKIRTEIWAGHEIRFVEKGGEWWAVLKDVTDALELGTREVNRRLSDDVLSKHHIPDSLGRLQEMLIVSEYGIYEAVFESRKKEAKEFKRWVYEMLKTLRKASGLEGFQIFRMLDKEHQKEVMTKLNNSLRKPSRIDFIKANTIANKAISLKYGYPRMLKKENMTPEMLVDRQSLLEDTVNLMSLIDKYGLEISVSKTIYGNLSLKGGEVFEQS
jgi:prophage antirepressor-like protein